MLKSSHQMAEEKHHAELCHQLSIEKILTLPGAGVESKKTAREEERKEEAKASLHSGDI